MEEFVAKLNRVEDSYYGFIVAVMTYVKKKPSRMDMVKEYMDLNPTARTSDILGFISDQKDFYEDAAYVHAETG